MKAIKYILLVFVLSCSTLSIWAQYTVYQTSSVTYYSANDDSDNRDTHTSVFAPGATMSITAPVVQFQSTSAMRKSGSLLLNTTEESISGSNTNNDRNNGFGGRRGAADEEDEEDKDTPPADPNGPMEDPLPLTDALPCMLLLAVGYAVYIARKRRAAHQAH